MRLVRKYPCGCAAFAREDGTSANTIAWHMCPEHRRALDDADLPPEPKLPAGADQAAPFVVVNQQLRVVGASANLSRELQGKILQSIEPYRNRPLPERIKLGADYHLRSYPLAHGGALIFLYDGTHNVLRSQRVASHYGLTPREAQVLELVTHGLTNAEIADTLHIATSTTAEHIASLCRKMECTRRGQLLSKYFREAG